MKTGNVEEMPQSQQKKANTLKESRPAGLHARDRCDVENRECSGARCGELYRHRDERIGLSDKPVGDIGGEVGERVKVGSEK